MASSLTSGHPARSDVTATASVPLRPRHRKDPKQTVAIQVGDVARPERRSWHLWGLLWTLGLAGSLICLIPGVLTDQGQQNAQALAVICYVVIVIESFRNRTFGYLTGLKATEDVAGAIAKLRRAKLRLFFTCSCWHWETRTRKEPEYYTEWENRWDGQAQKFVSVEISKCRYIDREYQERVVSYTGRQEFEYADCEDVSPGLTDELFRYDAVRLELSHCWRADAATQARFEAEQAAFITRHRGRDQHFSYSLDSRLPGFRKRMLAIVDLRTRAPWMHWAWYAVASFAALSWPYRLWFDARTVEGRYELRKQIGGAR